MTSLPSKASDPVAVKPDLSPLQIHDGHWSREPEPKTLALLLMLMAPKPKEALE